MEGINGVLHPVVDGQSLGEKMNTIIESVSVVHTIKTGLSVGSLVGCLLQIKSSEEQFVKRLDQFRKENLGAAKVRFLPVCGNCDRETDLSRSLVGWHML